MVDQLYAVGSRDICIYLNTNALYTPYFIETEYMAPFDIGSDVKKIGFLRTHGRSLIYHMPLFEE